MTWTMCINIATNEHGTIHLLILVNKKTIVQCLFWFLLLLRYLAVSDEGRDVVWWHHRFTKYKDWPYTRKHKGVVFRFIHSGTRFQKRFHSPKMPNPSGRNVLHIQLNASPCVRGLNMKSHKCEEQQKRTPSRTMNISKTRSTRPQKRSGER